MNSYFRVRLSQVPTLLEDEITTHSFEHGASGVTEALAYTQPDLTYDPDLIPVKTHELDVFFLEKPQDNFFSGLSSFDKNIQWKIFEEENKDWLEEWKKGFKPFQLVGPFWIVPSWLETPAECEHPIFIDPGMAFGTGTHATTKMASYFVHKLAEKHKKEVPNWTLLDVGTGTAILAMLAAKSGFGLVTGIEIDPEARRVAKENVKLNKMPEIDISDALLEEVKGEYDVVIANIIDGVLINIRKDLLRVLKPGGFLFLTGILTERDNLFFEKFIEASNLKVLRRLEKEEWVGYWVQKPEVTVEAED
ncbi:50S ribosomal protein L11 methyltransferase [Bdellovibrio sp. HCB337]|uniref:50S ribosomal protein L11 methyltransferase n=1 Tax=Bdellovibrio sp. HCB337 TaxID=3394358 RepID=UPI0039A7589D